MVYCTGSKYNVHDVLLLVYLQIHSCSVDVCFLMSTALTLPQRSPSRYSDSYSESAAQIEHADLTDDSNRRDSI